MSWKNEHSRVDAMALLQAKNLLAEGYTFLAQRPTGPETAVVLDIKVNLEDDTIATGNFGLDVYGCYAQNVKVNSQHGRKKIATVLYDLAELILGTKMYNFWDGDECQTEEAIAFWKARKAS
jgi:hypothetical protein